MGTIESRAAEEPKHNWTRTGRMALTGVLIHAPYVHFFWSGIEWVLPGRGLSAVAGKVLLDQTVGMFGLYALLFPSVAIMEGASAKEAYARYQERWWPTMQTA